MSRNNPFRDANEYTDATGLLYLRARYYNPRQGRFFQPDPSRQEMNPYQYSLSNPIMFTDPSGFEAGEDCNLTIGSGVSAPCTTVKNGMPGARAAAKSIIGQYNGLEALAQLFIHKSLDPYADDVAGESARDRLEFILKITDRYYPLTGGVQFNENFLFQNSGLRDEYQDQPLHDDIWGGQSFQINHFLTSIRLGYDSSFLIAPLRLVLSIPLNECSDVAAGKLLIGHELVPDNRTEGEELEVWEQQYNAATPDHVSMFLTAVEADKNGNEALRDELLREIFSDGIGRQGLPYSPDKPFGEQGIYDVWGEGNSMQDFLLSLKGYRFGQEIQDGTIGSRLEAAEWLRREMS